MFSKEFFLDEHIYEVPLHVWPVHRYGHENVENDNYRGAENEYALYSLIIPLTTRYP